MSRGKHFAYASISYLLAYSGILEFYFDSQSGRVIKSRFLRWYCRIYILFVLSSITCSTNINWLKFPMFLTQSKLMSLFNVTYPVVVMLCVLSSILSTQRWQHRIFKMTENLLKMEELIVKPNHYYTSAQLPKIRRIFWIRLVLLMLRTLIFAWRIIIRGHGLLFLVSSILARLLRGSLFFLVFILIWQISYTFMKVQLSIEHMLLNPRSQQLPKLLELQKMCDRLLRMINEVCLIFKYPLGFYLLHLIMNCCLGGYTVFRVLFGNPLMSIGPKTDAMIVVLSILEILEFYALASIAEMASKLHGSAIIILRYPYRIVDQLERRNDWFALHLTLQNMDVRIFGVFTINLRLFFAIVTSIVLHIIYMIQSDYDYLKI